MSNPSTEERLALVSGATNGIGLVTARELARQGFTVVGVGRDAQRAAAVQDQLRREAGSERIHFLLADLSSLAQVRALADTFRQRFGRLDVLVNNAGAYFSHKRLTQDGIEMTFALNHLSYFLLTTLLLDILKASAPARIVNVASDAHQGWQVDLEDLPNPRRYGAAGFQAYGNSKLCNVAFTYALASRLQGSGVTANALHPGFVATKIGTQNMNGLMALARPLYRLYSRLAARTPEQGADTVLYLAAAAEAAGLNGQYLADRQPRRSHPQTYDPAIQAGLWALSERLCGLQPAAR